MSIRLTIEQFIEKARRVHGDKYDYSLADYKNNITKIKIVCPVHGVFWQIPRSHLRGHGCKYCGASHTNKLSKELFLKRAIEKHGGKYDYSQVEYIDGQTLVDIMCPVHGLFRQRPYNHIYGQGCPKCASSGTKLTNEEFIVKATIKHNNKYDYSLVNYKNNKIKVKIICAEHGVFEQTPHSHLSGAGCPLCAGNTTISKTEFVSLAKEVHGDKYNYSLVEYKNRRSPVVIICKNHGEFRQSPSAHLKGAGCPYCNGKIDRDDKWFIAEARKIHGDKYDYNLIKYKNQKCKIIIVCPIHGEFSQEPLKHLKGAGCPSCGQLRSAWKNRLSLDQFIQRSRHIHNNKYDYSMVDYKGYRTNVTIICPIHGEFRQSPFRHMFMGYGCPHCASLISSGHQHVIDYVRFIYDDRLIINDKEIIAPLELDIYLPAIKLAIEYNGRYWHSIKTQKDRFYHQKKHLLCKEKDIRLIQIDEHLWKKKRKWFEKLIRDAIEGRPLVYDKSKETILVDARYDDGTSLLKEGYRLVKLTKPYRFVVKRKYAVYDAGRYIYQKRNGSP